MRWSSGDQRILKINVNFRRPVMRFVSQLPQKQETETAESASAKMANSLLIFSTGYCITEM